MSTQKSYIDSNGRLAIPAKVRQTLKLKPGDEVSISYDNSQLVVLPFHSNLQKARDILSKYAHIDLHNELKTLREEDAAKE